jgi:hypothetical protein
VSDLCDPRVPARERAERLDELGPELSESECAEILAALLADALELEVAVEAIHNCGMLRTNSTFVVNGVRSVLRIAAARDVLGEDESEAIVAMAGWLGSYAAEFSHAQLAEIVLLFDQMSVSERMSASSGEGLRSALRPLRRAIEGRSA